MSLVREVVGKSILFSSYLGGKSLVRNPFNIHMIVGYIHTLKGIHKFNKHRAKQNTH